MDLPLYKIYVHPAFHKSSTWGVYFSNGTACDEQLYLKSIHPLCDILNESITVVEYFMWKCLMDQLNGEFFLLGVTELKGLSVIA